MRIGCPPADDERDSQQPACRSSSDRNRPPLSAAGERPDYRPLWQFAWLAQRRPRRAFCRESSRDRPCRNRDRAAARFLGRANIPGPLLRRPGNARADRDRAGPHRSAAHAVIHFPLLGRTPVLDAARLVPGTPGDARERVRERTELAGSTGRRAPHQAFRDRARGRTPCATAHVFHLPAGDMIRSAGRRSTGRESRVRVAGRGSGLRVRDAGRRSQVAGCSPGRGRLVRGSSPVATGSPSKTVWRLPIRYVAMRLPAIPMQRRGA